MDESRAPEPEEPEPDAVELETVGGHPGRGPPPRARHRRLAGRHRLRPPDRSSSWSPTSSPESNLAGRWSPPSRPDSSSPSGALIRRESADPGRGRVRRPAHLGRMVARFTQRQRLRPLPPRSCSRTSPTGRRSWSRSSCAGRCSASLWGSSPDEGHVLAAPIRMLPPRPTPPRPGSGSRSSSGASSSRSPLYARRLRSTCTGHRQGRHGLAAVPGRRLLHLPRPHRSSRTSEPGDGGRACGRAEAGNDPPPGIASPRQRPIRA
jgi:hypothetical protein